MEMPEAFLSILLMAGAYTDTEMSNEEIQTALRN